MLGKIVIALTVPATAVLWAASAQGHASSTASTRPHTVHLHFTGGRPGAFGGVVQHRGRETAGDSFTIAATLYAGSARAGTYDAVCVTTLTGKRVLCEETLTLARGQIETQASESERSRTNTAAIVGGTGAYRRASGTVTITDRSDGNTFDVTLVR